MFTRQIPIYYLVITVIVSCIFSYCGIRSITKEQANVISSIQKVNTLPAERLCTYDLPRLSGYKYIRPLLSADQECESENLAPVKADLMDAIRGMQSSGEIISASIYIRDFTKGDWISVNDKEKYTPASMMKVPMLVTYLKMAEDNPALLNKEVLFEGPQDNKLQFFKSKTIQVGHTYTIKELLNYMIAYSDNNATNLLARHMDQVINTRMFSDLGLPAISDHGAVYNMTAREMSTFLQVLYDASYLSIRSSEFATSFLTECDFKNGLAAGIPDSVKVAHKFGEYFNKLSYQLHETGLIYLDNRTYLITVMTKGNDMDQLAKAIGTFSKIVYTDMARKKSTS